MRLTPFDFQVQILNYNHHLNDLSYHQKFVVYSLQSNFHLLISLVNFPIPHYHFQSKKFIDLIENSIRMQTIICF